MLKICFVNPHYYKKVVGGAEVQMYLLAREFFKHGWEVHYVTEDISNKTIDDDIILHSFKKSRSIKKSYLQFIKILNHINADVYYQRGRKLYTAFMGRFSEETGKAFIFSTSMDIDCRKYKQIPRILTSKTNFVKKIWHIINEFKIDKLSLEGIRNASLILCQSTYQQEALKRNLGIESKTFRNVHPVPDEKRILKCNPPIILWLANIKPIKQPELFLKLAEELRNIDCKFILAGRMVSANYRKYINALESKMNNFTYIENVSFEQSNDLISKSSIFVNTSLSEGFPNVFIQDWLRKTPTVTLNCDPDNIIKKERLGFHSQNFDQLLKDVTKLISNKTLRESMGNNARNHAITHYGIENNFGNLLCETMELIK